MNSFTDTLALAAKAGDVGRVKNILYKSTHSQKERAFEGAVRDGFLPIVQVLLADDKLLSRTRAMEGASFSGNLPIVKWLVESGMAVIGEDSDDNLYMAVCQGHCEIVGYLLSKGANVNASDECGKNLITIAKSNKNEKMVELLLKYGAKTEDIDQDATEDDEKEMEFFATLPDIPRKITYTINSEEEALEKRRELYGRELYSREVSP